MTKNLPCRVLLCLVAALGWVNAVPVKNNHVEAELVAEKASIQPGHSIDIGLKLKPDAHWHTYWKNPGDAGLPPKMTWSLPPGFTAGQIQWPTPQTIDTAGIISYGYPAEVLLISTLQVPADIKTGAAVKISAKVDWLACADVCVPGHADLTLTLPVKTEVPQTNGPASKLFAATLKQIPAAKLPWTIKAVSDAKGIVFVLPSEMIAALRPVDMYFMSDTPEQVDSTAKQIFTESGGDLRVKRPDSAPAIDKVSGLLILTRSKDRGLEGRSWQMSAPLSILKTIPVVPTAGGPVRHSTPVAVHAATLSTAAIFLFAFIGGLVLNLMPCVLPVLSIKVLGLVRHAGDDQRSALEQMIAFTMGVLVSFWTLAGVLLALRSAGEQLGWGFQMQSPMFVMFLCAIFFLFALNLLGVFEIGASLVGIDANAVQQPGLWGSFGTGALATLSATPCTAPFMGSALGVAVNQSPAIAMATFTFLGLGMAAPYLVLGLFPQLLRFVPKPGRWMETFKQFLGFVLLGTVIFLLWVFGQETSLDAQSLLLVSLLMIGMGAWVYGRYPGLTGGTKERWSARGLAVKFMIVGFGWGMWIAHTGVAPSVAAAQNGNGIDWQPYTPERVEQLRAAGKPVFIDFTASWCVNCKVNEAVALNRTQVARAFKDKGIVALRADWTRYDENITHALAGFGRDGVPLYVLYGRNPAGEPDVLPEVITPKIVLDAIAKVH